MSLSRKICENIDPSEQTDDLRIYKGGNDLSTLCDETEIVVVGSFMPPHLLYFYNENPYMYRAIDEARKTNLLQYKRRYWESISEEARDRMVASIQSILQRERIAFIDLADRILTRKGHFNDRSIIKMAVDEKAIYLLKNCKNLKKIISVTEDVEEILTSFEVISQYVKLFPGKSRRFPTGTDYRELWLRQFC